MRQSNFIKPVRVMEPTMALETITPETAAEYLKRNKTNRKLSSGHVKKLAREISKGAWEVNGETIGFDVDGNLVQGQHRLHAVIEAGTSIDVFVARNLSRNAFATMDCGKTRGGADVLSVKGVEHSIEIAAALRIVHASKLSPLWKGWPEPNKAERPSNNDFIGLLERHPGVADSANRMMLGDRKMCRKLLSGSVAIFTHYWLTMIDADEAEQFFEWLEFCENIPRIHPVSLLRNRLLDSIGSSRSAAVRREHMALVFRSWNAVRHGEHLKLLKFSQSSSFPTPI